MTGPIPYLSPRFAEVRPASADTARVPMPQGKRRSNLPIALMALPQAAAAIYDAESTFDLKDRGGLEGNPIMRPIVNAGRGPTYAALGLEAAGQALIAKKLRDAGKRYWWAPQAISAIGHTIAGTMNRGINR